MAIAHKSKPLPGRVSGSPSRDVLVAVVLLAFALAVRVPLVGQSLWYDEMYTMLYYAGQPFKTILTSFSPNNHVLYSLLARVSLLAGGVNDTMLRLPAILAGTLLPVVLAWPLRKDLPALAIILGLLAAVQPWLAAFSIEGRGYTLMLLLSILATQRLSAAVAKIDWAYILLLAAAVYTVPIALAIVLGHAVAVFIVHRTGLRRWLACVAIAAGIVGLLYLPLFPSMLRYRAAVHRPSLSYGQFLADLPRFLLMGWSPREGHWFSPNIPAVVAWIVAFGVIGGGIIIAFRRRILLPEVITFAVATVLSLLVPLLLPDAGEVRFAAWIIPLFLVSLSLLLTPSPCLLVPLSPCFPAPSSFRRFVAPSLLLILSAIPLIALWRIPAQPVYEAIAAAEDHVAESGGTIVGVYLSADEARAVYQPEPPMLVAYDLPALQRMEQERPKPLWAIVFYPQFLNRDRPELMQHLAANYQLVQRFDGRISPVILYRKP
jgi:hypothetical protein